MASLHTTLEACEFYQAAAATLTRSFLYLGLALNYNSVQCSLQSIFRHLHQLICSTAVCPQAIFLPS